jgi:hypothetical protein
VAQYGARKSRELVSLLATYRKEKQSGMRDDREGTERVDVLVFPFYFPKSNLKIEISLITICSNREPFSFLRSSHRDLQNSIPC